MNKNENEFKAWEYVDVNVKRNQATLYTDCYRNFGWNLIEQCEIHPSATVPSYNTTENINVATPTVKSENDFVKLKFKRDSKLANKIEITELQEKCEEALSTIQTIENKKSAFFMGPIIGFGIVGALFIGLSIFNFVSANILLCVVFAICSLIGWGAAYFAFAKVHPKKSEKYSPRIKEQFDTIYRTCEQANALLA